MEKCKLLEYSQCIKKAYSQLKAYRNFTNKLIQTVLLKLMEIKIKMMTLLNQVIKTSRPTESPGKILITL